MPSLGADMDSGTVSQWLVKVGDHVHRGDIVAVVDTDKADVDVEIFQDGVIDRILVSEGKKVAVGTPLASLDAAAAPGVPPAPTPVPEPERPPAPPPVPVPEPMPWPNPEPAPGPEPLPVPGERLLSVGERTHSPVLRRLAEHLGVDLELVSGSAAGGAITRADINAAAASAPRPSAAMPAAVEDEETDRVHRDHAMRDAIGRLMARSKREIPHYYLGTDIDFLRARSWLDQANGLRPVSARLLPAVLLIKAVALACGDTPDMNGFFTDDRFRASAGVHVGVAISLRSGGLVAPAIHDADGKGLDELMAELRDLVSRTRTGRLRSSEMSDPTITVTNLGELGVRTVYGVIYPPQVALVGFGRITERVWVEDSMIGVRPLVSTTLAADHRASDGHTGARFLARIDRLLQDPEAL
jgi:pyruvate dehydrogenase E2 component (dihydrolipoamide acetyltransferase)